MNRANCPPQARRNKHIFPASRWETFDPEKSYERYTTHGSEVN